MGQRKASGMSTDVLSSNQVRMQRYRVLAQEARMSAVQLLGKQQSALTESCKEWERLAAVWKQSSSRAVPASSVQTRPARLIDGNNACRHKSLNNSAVLQPASGFAWPNSAS
jgi:hypothetical protein